jgi:endonuclease/exonuclease/phosphatase family metal-dependent hydrolase
LTLIRLASWNIRKCVGLDRRRDPHRVARVLAGIGADVVALQEADRRLGKRPAALPAALVTG